MVRETAKICSIKELLAGEYVVQEGWQPNYVLYGERKLSRVNIMGLVVDKPTPFQFMLDDGTGTIQVIDFNNNPKTAKLKISDPVLIVGRPRKTEDKTFIACEIANSTQLKKQPGWIIARKQSLKKQPVPVESKEPVEEYVPDEQVATITTDDVVDFIKKKDDGNGCLIETIIEYFGKEADDIILTLLSMGEVFEIKPGKLKVLE